MSFLALRLLGGDFAVLQVMAWTGMIVSRTAERGITAAVQSTVTGDEPCPMCKAIKAAQQSEQEKQPVAPDGLITKLKLKDMLRSEDLVLAAPCPHAPLSRPPTAGPALALLTRSDAPPVPPPRLIAA